MSWVILFKVASGPPLPLRMSRIRLKTEYEKRQYPASTNRVDGVDVEFVILLAESEAFSIAKELHW